MKTKKWFDDVFELYERKVINRTELLFYHECIMVEKALGIDLKSHLNENFEPLEKEIKKLIKLGLIGDED